MLKCPDHLGHFDGSFGLWDTHSTTLIHVNKHTHTYIHIHTHKPTTLSIYAYGFILLIWTYLKPIFMCLRRSFKRNHHNIKGRYNEVEEAQCPAEDVHVEEWSHENTVKLD